MRRDYHDSRDHAARIARAVYPDAERLRCTGCKKEFFAPTGSTKCSWCLSPAARIDAPAPDRYSDAADARLER